MLSSLFLRFPFIPFIILHAKVYNIIDILYLYIVYPVTR